MRGSNLKCSMESFYCVTVGSILIGLRREDLECLFRPELGWEASCTYSSESDDLSYCI